MVTQRSAVPILRHDNFWKSSQSGFCRFVQDTGCSFSSMRHALSSLRTQILLYQQLLVINARIRGFL
jgi:hypothetical protein